jgi:RNA polymerase sporulation-specific sigma factor
LIFDMFFNLLDHVFLLVGYVTSGNSFPQPLNEEEERSLFTSYKLGDDSAKNELITRNLRLVAHIIKKFNPSSKDTDDLISIGTVGLIKAIESFDYNKGNRLATYAARCIENEILMYARTSKKVKSEVYLQDPIGVDKEGNEMRSRCYTPGLNYILGVSFIRKLSSFASLLFKYSTLSIAFFRSLFFSEMSLVCW